MAKRKKRKRSDEAVLKEKLNSYAQKVLDSEIFKRSFEERHHFISSVGEHSTQVAIDALRLAERFQKWGIPVDEEAVARAALLHDLGLVGRHNKYRTNRETSRQHPIDSAKIAKEMYPESGEKLANIIKRHMWPVALLPPNTVEGLVVNLADKWSSTTNLLFSAGALWFIFKKTGKLFLKGRGNYR